MMDPETFSRELEAAAKAAGAHSAACVRMDNPRLRRGIAENHRRVSDWLATGAHGEMAYLERMLAEKSNPWKTFPFARSAVVVAFGSGWGDPTAEHPFPAPGKDALVGYVSAYARGVDYHRRGRAILEALAGWLGDGEHAVSVDGGAVYERLFAEVSGLGKIGGNTLLRVPGRNTRVFVGCLFTERELPQVRPATPLPFPCEACQACIQNCPTGAIARGRPIDARRCVSYLTIEKRGLLEPEEERMIGHWIFGCDDCTSVCPPVDSADARIPVDLEWLLECPTGELRRLLQGSAAARAGPTRLRRNAVAVLKNIGTPRAHALLARARKNAGSDLVRQQIDMNRKN